MGIFYYFYNMTARPTVSIYDAASETNIDGSATPTWPSTEDKPMASTGRLATSTPPSLGELVVPSHVFHVSQVLVLTGPARVLSVTSAVRVACLPHSRSGENGKERLT